LPSIANANPTADGDTQHQRSRPCQCFGVVARTRTMHLFLDPDAGRYLAVVTAPPPVRASSGSRTSSRWRCWNRSTASAVRLNSDDITTEIAPDKIILGRPGGLELSPGRCRRRSRLNRGPAHLRCRRVAQESERKLHGAGAGARRCRGGGRPDQRAPARIDLAVFYLARGMYPEAKGVLDLALADTRRGEGGSGSLIVHRGERADGPS